MQRRRRADRRDANTSLKEIFPFLIFALQTVSKQNRNASAAGSAGGKDEKEKEKEKEETRSAQRVLCGAPSRVKFRVLHLPLFCVSLFALRRRFDHFLLISAHSSESAIVPFPSFLLLSSFSLLSFCSSALLLFFPTLATLSEHQ